MRKLFSILFVVSFCFTGYSQVIRGIVLDKNTNARVNFAAVYINGTFVGTHTDDKGNFELDISGYRTIPLTVSALGYYSANLSDPDPGKQYMIYLDPKVYQLQEVVITASSKWYERRTYYYYFKFKKEFLGTSSNAAMCDIKNAEEIMTYFKGKSDTLKASSMNPILIRNRSLGYNIKYYLDEFETSYNTRYLLVLGNYIFFEDSTKNENQAERFEKRRALAYSGSRMHFFRALWENNLDSAGFTIRDSTNKILTYKDLVVRPDPIAGGNDLKYIKYKGSLNIAYHSKLPRTQIRILKDSVGFDRNGYFDPIGIAWRGEMSDQRVGDLLPYEYKSK